MFLAALFLAYQASSLSTYFLLLAQDTITPVSGAPDGLAGVFEFTVRRNLGEACRGLCGYADSRFDDKTLSCALINCSLAVARRSGNSRLTTVLSVDSTSDAHRAHMQDHYCEIIKS